MFILAALTESDVEATLEVTDQAFQAVRKRRPTLGPVEKINVLLAGRR